MLCDMSHTTCGKFFRFEVAKLPPQTQRPPAQRLANANPAYVRGVGLAQAKAGPGRSPAVAGRGGGRGSLWARPMSAPLSCVFLSVE
jgi:hypothetical protein